MRSSLLDLSLTASPGTAPVFPGEHPDPTILRVGEHFWASSTSGEWSPQFPLFHSTDLIHWEPRGAIFPFQPAWSDGAFWAPELVEDRGRFLVFYVARARGGTLSIAVATASSPRGPWQDHGPILTEPLGSIDPCFARDEHGQPFLIWKTDGNSQKQPTPIWAQPLSPDLLHLTGTRTELITNDQPWEGDVVEGPYIFRRAGHFFLFYAGNSCCGRECQYAEGVARADHLLGPWTKSPTNPLINANSSWRCPGHGTAIHGSTMHGQKGQDYFLYHAYPTAGSIYVGREAVLDRISWTSGGWPIVNAGHGPHALPAPTAITYTDDFTTPTLADAWQWPVNTHPITRTGPDPVPPADSGPPATQGALHLRIPVHRQSAMVAVPSPGACAYTATVALGLTSSPSAFGSMPDPVQPETPTFNPPPATSWAGLSVVGDPFNTAGLGLRNGTLELWQRSGAEQHVPWSTPLPPGTPTRIWLRVRVSGAAQLTFSLSLDGSTFTPAGSPVDGSTLPAWDRGLRIALMLDGPGRTLATFQCFSLTTEP